MNRAVTWVVSHRSRVATALSIIVIGALVATVAIASSGYQAQKLDLDDGTVWVANGGKTAVGRANPAVLQLNAAVRSSGSDLQVVQDADHVLLFDRSDATVGTIDTATATVSQTVPLPPNEPDVLMAGSTVAIVSGKTGELWSQPVSTLDSFDASSQADLSLGADAVSDLSPDGVLTVYSPDSARVSRIDQVSQFDVSSTAHLALPKRDTFQVANVGSHWAVLDTDTNRLVFDGRTVDLSSEVSGQVDLQRSSDSGSSVVVASRSGLVSVSTGGTVTTLESGRNGDAARPVVVGGCTYAAWDDGTAWNDCSSPHGRTQALASITGSGSLQFAVNGTHVVLNDPLGGDSWAVQRSGQLIDNWSDLIKENTDQQQEQVKADDQQQKLDTDPKPPVAVADTLGARPGRASVLPVLLNDYDPNGDPIVISDVGSIDPNLGTLDVIDNRQELLLTLKSTASGTLRFDYSITDGRGGSASTTVTVPIRQPGENSAPEQQRQTTATVASSGRVTVNTLGDWNDADGDPFYLTDATGGDGGTVTFKPSGEVVYQDAGKGPSTQEIILSVSDGTAVGRGTLTITVGAAGQVPIVAFSFSVEAYADQQKTIDPLQYATGGTGTIKLNSVPAKAGATVTPNYETGQVAFLSSQVGTYNLEYTVTDGDKTATGTIRVDVNSPPPVNSTPITTPKTVFVQSLDTQSVDITTSDFDPAGNVLMVSATSAVPASTGVQVETLEQRYLRITLTKPLDAPVPFTYTVTNGLASAEGSVTVVQIPRPARLQPPIATNDQVTARVGDAIDIDVLANDEQPDGETVTLQPQLVQNVATGGGLLFVSGQELRYLAPKSPGNYTAEYAIEGPDGQRATAQVTISVREADTATNNPPVPQTLIARVVAGQTVRVQVPLSGIDPDGDSVTLLGLDSNPQKGNVTTVGSDYIDYEAGSYSAGTDTFTYTVIDGLGARATGTIQIGISARAEQSGNPVAVADTATMRPGGSILVRALANDSDPNGGSLHLTSVKPNDKSVTAKILGNGVVRITPPKKAGSYGLVYTVTNDFGGSSSNFITVKVDAKAPLNYPEASDSTLSLSDVLNRKTVDVNVLANVFFADGPVSTLGLGVEPGYGKTATVTANRHIRVTITNSSQIIPFYVTHPGDTSIKSFAFIKVPGYDDALPQINEKAAPLTVASEKTLTIDLNKYVVASGGKGIKLTGSDTVHATHANGDDLVVNGTTLQFTSAPLFFGNASISFQVTDGSSANDPKGHTATLVLPITVTARQNQPPVFNGTQLQLEPGDSRTIDLTKLTTYPYPKDLHELTYAVTSTSTPGFTSSVSGQTLTINANANAVKGSTSTLTLGVKDAASQGRAGTISLTVVGSTRPLAIANSDAAVTKRGQTTTIDVLANDQATNPFPGQPLRVVAIRGIGGASLPAGVSVSPSANNSVLTVSVTQSAQPINTNFQYELADVTNDPARYVYGNVTISVQDVPDAPAAPTRPAGNFVGGRVTLSYGAPQANNSAITDYQVTGTSPTAATYTQDCGLSTVCTLTGLDPASFYTFSVVAANAIGASQPSAQSAKYSADYVPAAPTGVTATPSTSTQGALDVSWNAVPTPNRGSAVSGYVVEISGGPGTQSTGSTSTTIGGLTPGTTYTIQVYATNQAQVQTTADWSRSAAVSATAVGAPAAFSASATTDAGGNGNVTVSHTASSSAGASSVSYSYGRANAAGVSAPACSPTSKPGLIDMPNGIDTSARDDGTTYTYFVFADNGLFCTSASTGPVQSLDAPGQATASLTTSQGDANGYFDVTVVALGQESGTSGSYQVAVGSSWTPISIGDKLTSAQDSSVYGTEQSYQIRGCRTSDGSLCGPPVTVAATPYTTRSTIVQCTVGQPLTVTPPSNRGSQATSVTVEFSADPIGITWIGSDSDGAFTTTSTVPSYAQQVRVRYAVAGHTDPGYATSTCSSP